jgi:tRNA-2-methylthio-N6-dimethylallyladenosine synthase
MMQDDVNLETKKERLKILQEQINKYGMEISESMVGSLQNVIVTHFAKHKNQLSSRTENNRTTFFTGGIDLIGQAVDVKITNALPNYLLATLSPN